MDDAYLARKESSFNVPPYLSVTRAGDREVVHIGCTPIANHFVSDVTSRRQVLFFTLNREDFSFVIQCKKQHPCTSANFAVGIGSKARWHCGASDAARKVP